MGRLEDIDKEIKEILGEIEPNNENRLSQTIKGDNNIQINKVQGDVIINKTSKKGPARAAAMAGGVLIIALTITIQSDSVKKNPNLYASEHNSAYVTKAPTLAGEISIIPAAAHEPLDMSINNKPARCLLGPGCSRNVSRPAASYFNNRNQKI